jgi:GNAT superfamily N-acetyltransferase
VSPIDPVIVRRAVAADAAAVAVILARGTLRDDEDPSSPHLYAAAIERVRAAHGEVFVADVAGDVVGVCEVLYLEYLQHRGGHAAELESVHVLEAHRGRGIGAALVAATVEWARERGCYRVQLTSNEVRTDAHRFYEAHGFTASHVGFKLFLD